MKTTTRIAAAKRLTKQTVSKSSVAYQVVAELLKLEGAKPTYKIFDNGKTIRPVHTSGSGRFCTNMDYTKGIQHLLSSIGIDSTLTNDSPRGGLTGNLLTITTKIN